MPLPNAEDSNNCHLISLVKGQGGHYRRREDGFTRLEIGSLGQRQERTRAAMKRDCDR